MAERQTRQSETKLTSVQFEIMDLFWEHGELGVAQVWGMLSKKRKVARNTVQTMLTRLAEKGWLQSRTEGTAFCFRATRPRKSTLRAMVNQLVDTAFGGSVSGLVMTLLESRRLAPGEAQRVLELIEGKPEGKK